MKHHRKDTYFSSCKCTWFLDNMIWYSDFTVATGIPKSLQYSEALTNETFIFEQQWEKTKIKKMGRQEKKISNLE